MKTVLKLLTALAAIAGAVYVIATYGDQIVAWAKDIMAKLPKCPCCEEPAVDQTEADAQEAAVEEAAAEEVPAEEIPAEEPAEEVVVEENEPVAEDTDFEA